MLTGLVVAVPCHLRKGTMILSHPFGSVLLLRTPSYGNFAIEPFCSALHQLPKEAQIAEAAVKT